MKPERIILLRHGESEGNVDKNVYSQKPDYSINLTENGKEQAKRVGKELLDTCGSFDQFAVYYSPFFRAIQTLNMIGTARDEIYNPPFNKKWIMEDSRIREQEWHGKIPTSGYDETAELEREAYGHFYYRFAGGESAADTYDRVSDFMETLHRDFRKEDYPKNCLIITHGMTLRVFVMRWFHITVKEFESWANPENCKPVILEKQSNDKYKLITPFKTHEPRHNYKCSLDINTE